MMHKPTMMVALALSGALAYSIVSAVPSLAVPPGPPEIPTVAVIVVNPENHPGVRSGLANELVDYLVTARAQTMIRDYQVEGESLFYSLPLSEEK